MTRNYYQGLPPVQRTPQQRLDEMRRTEPRDRAGREVLAWLTDSAEYVGPPPA